MAKPLQGIRILDLTQGLAGPFGAMMLADFGADVIKVESHKGDLTRQSPPHYIDGTSLYFISNNQNKRSVVIDLKSDKGYEVFADLVRKSDAVYYNFGPGVAKRLRIDDESLAQFNPDIITARVEGYGARNVEPDQRLVDLIAQGAAGAMSITGEPGRPPVRAGVPTADLAAGLFSLIGLLVALVGRKSPNPVHEVETTLFHSQLALLNYMASYSVYSGQSPQPVGSGHVSTVPSQAFEAQDAWMVIDAGLDGHFRELCSVMGIEGMASDTRYSTRKARNENRVALVATLQSIFKTQPTGYWLPRMQVVGIPCSRTNTLLEAMAEPPVERYGMLRQVDYGSETVRALGSPLWFDGDLDYGRSVAPHLGEHTREVLRDLLAYDDEKIAALMEAGIIARC
jgi:crotonobetainyl-CoA:carnitine CoA-transferase CaiB-like acyl-CoA transferase